MSLDSQKVKKKHSQTVDGTKSCQLALMFKNMSIFVVLSFHLQFLSQVLKYTFKVWDLRDLPVLGVLNAPVCDAISPGLLGVL